MERDSTVEHTLIDFASGNRRVVNTAHGVEIWSPASSTHTTHKLEFTPRDMLVWNQGRHSLLLDEFNSKSVSNMDLETGEAVSKTFVVTEKNVLDPEPTTLSSLTPAKKWEQRAGGSTLHSCVLLAIFWENPPTMHVKRHCPSTKTRG